MLLSHLELHGSLIVITIPLMAVSHLFETTRATFCDDRTDGLATVGAGSADALLSLHHVEGVCVDVVLCLHDTFRRGRDQADSARGAHYSLMGFLWLV